MSAIVDNFNTIANLLPEKADDNQDDFLIENYGPNYENVNL